MSTACLTGMRVIVRLFNLCHPLRGEDLSPLSATRIPRGYRQILPVLRQELSCLAQMATFLLCAAEVALVLWAAGASDARSQPAPEDPRALVSQVVSNELEAQQNDNTYWMYVSEVQQPEKTQTQHVIETKEGSLTLLAAENGRALTPQQQHQEDKRINSLIHNPGELRKQKQEQERDAQKEQQLLKMLPDGFLYQYEADEGRNIRLSFRPNPKFRPPTREAKVFHAMQGTMLVDGVEKRLVELRGQLMRDVVFGWGIFGRLYAGGTFDVQQREVAPGHWEATLIDVHIRGKALFFKTINEQQHQVRSDFQQVSGTITLEQAAEMLKEQVTLAR